MNYPNCRDFAVSASQNEHWATEKHMPQQSLIHFAGLHLPCLIALLSTAPADEYMLICFTPHKLNCSRKAWRRIILGRRQ
jgi:hypothetical protein